MLCTFLFRPLSRSETGSMFTMHKSGVPLLWCREASQTGLRRNATALGLTEGVMGVLCNTFSPKALRCQCVL